MTPYQEWAEEEEEEQEEKGKFMPEFQRGQKPELPDCRCKLRDEWKEKKGGKKNLDQVSQMLRSGSVTSS